MKVLTEYQFRTRTRTTYDWNTILDGKIRLLESGKDFLCKPETFVIRARTIAKKHGLKLRASVSENGDVVLQAVQPLDPKNAQKVQQDKSSSSQSEAVTKEDEELEEEQLDEEWNDDETEEVQESEDEQLDEDDEEWEDDDEVEATLKALEKRERKKYK